MLKRSGSSAGATYLNRPQRVAAIREAVSRAAGRLGTLRRVVLFGSLADGIPTPRSDADLLVEVSESPYPEPRDRIPDLLCALSPLPCPVDLFVLTSEEIENSRARGSPFLEMILRTGVVLWQG